jgi:hypothetical protein
MTPSGRVETGIRFFTGSMAEISGAAMFKVIGDFQRPAIGGNDKCGRPSPAQ